MSEDGKADLCARGLRAVWRCFIYFFILFILNLFMNVGRYHLIAAQFLLLVFFLFHFFFSFFSFFFLKKNHYYLL